MNSQTLSATSVAHIIARAVTAECGADALGAAVRLQALADALIVTSARQLGACRRDYASRLAGSLFVLAEDAEYAATLLASA